MTEHACKVVVGVVIGVVVLIAALLAVSLKKLNSDESKNKNTSSYLCYQKASAD